MSQAISTGKGYVFGTLPEQWRDVFTKQAVQTETICQEQMWKVD